MVEVSKTNIESSNALSSLDEGKRGSSGLRKDCPADVERLGRHTWTFLHTTASYYPTSPNETQQRSMLQLLKALPVLYPCRNCAEDLELEISRRPPDVSSREKLEQWMCRTHNEVNRRLGKDEFDCSMVAQRWRDGWKDGRCDEWILKEMYRSQLNVNCMTLKSSFSSPDHNILANIDSADHTRWHIATSNDVSLYPQV